jgi:small subunit ribosomal protein S27Ae
MQIIVGATAYEVDAATSVESLKAQIENREFLPANQIRLMHGGIVLEGGSLESFGVEEDDELALQLEVVGGMRKKWRKKRMRRLRRKRRKMRQRAR